METARLAMPQQGNPQENPQKNFLAAYWPHLTWIGTFVVIWLIPAPDGVNPKAWHLLAIFVATIVGFMTKCRIPYDWIYTKRHPLFMARDVLRALLTGYSDIGITRIIPRK
jgi:hypothetical protein